MQKIKAEIRDEMIRLRHQGLTYAEIGKIFGVTKQSIYQEIWGERTRKATADIGKIAYDGVRQLFVEEPHMTFRKFCKIAYGTEYPPTPAQYELIRRFLFGVSNTAVPLRVINNILRYIGKPYEEVFRRTDCATCAHHDRDRGEFPCSECDNARNMYIEKEE